MSDTGFVACYADPDAFKPYIDVYGYRRGDDFMILFQSHDWEARCQHALTLFDQRIAGSSLFVERRNATKLRQ